jgi:hypothetical protein
VLFAFGLIYLPSGFYGMNECPRSKKKKNLLSQDSYIFYYKVAYKLQIDITVHVTLVN